MEYFDIGKIVNTQGLKGEVRVQPITDFPDERFKKGEKVTAFLANGKTVNLEIDGKRKHKNFILLHFKGLDSINDVEYLKPSILRIDTEQQESLKLAPDTYFYHQIIGLDVFKEDGEKVGTIKDIMDLGPNDVWVVERDNDNDLLLPKIDDVIKEVDLDNHKVIVDVLEGLE
ncbi:ribosome maturation factor RimM [Fructilactobacillus sp. Tb1]|uniref:ribosome maturation factor RimM n=1 Tax=Fructilactobacillus sp. Tb1 TaxID=3422304 RepID=UPI003D2DEBB6